MTKSRILLIDDHPLMRKGLSQLLAFEPEFGDILEASNGTDALAQLRRCAVDLIVLDLNMKGLSGLDTLIALRQAGCDAVIVILTVSDSQADIQTLLHAGADGYLLKDCEPEELIEKLKQAAQGAQVFCQQVQDKIGQFSQDKITREDGFAQLTKRELQILQLVAKGFRNKQIADVLFISEATVKVHLKNMWKKLGVESRLAATLVYLEYCNRYGNAIENGASLPT